MNTNLNTLTKGYMDNMKVIDTVIDYLDDNGDRSGLRSYALVYLDNGNDVLAEPYSLEHDLVGNVNVHYYNRELPTSYIIAG